MSRASVLGLLGLGTYGAAMAATGVALAVSSVGGSVAVAAGPADGGAGVTSSTSLPSAAPLAGRTLEPDPARSPGSVPVGGSLTPGKAPVARVGTAAPGQPLSFVPLELVLPNGRSAPVQTADVNPDGSLVIPDNPQVVGYWSGGAKPGEPFGSLVIAGHVDSARYGIGILAGLKGVEVGEVIEVRNGKQKQRYRVTGTRTVPQASLGSDNRDIFDQDAPARLIVITCGGPFNTVTHRYRDNFIVTALPTA